MPRVLPLTVWRQLEGTPPENWFWLTFSVCSSLSEDHDGGSVPVSVLLLRFTFVRCVLPDQEAGSVPAQGKSKPSKFAKQPHLGRSTLSSLLQSLHGSPQGMSTSRSAAGHSSNTQSSTGRSCSTVSQSNCICR